MVFLVAGLFIGTTLAGASVIETYSNTEEPCPPISGMTPGVQTFSFRDFQTPLILRCINTELLDGKVEVRFTVEMNFDGGYTCANNITLDIIENDEEVISVHFDRKHDRHYCELYFFTRNYTKNGTYTLKAKADAWNSKADQLGHWYTKAFPLKVNVGKEYWQKSKSKDDPKEEPCPAAGNGNPGIRSFFFQDIRTPLIYRCTNTELVDGKVEVRFHVDLSFSGEGGPATDIDLDILENDIEVVSVHIDRNDEDMSETYIFTRTFTNNGTYTLKPKADAYNSEGTHWGTFAFPLKVNVGKEYWQKSKVNDDQLGFRLLLLKFLDRFPVLQRILHI